MSSETDDPDDDGVPVAGGVPLHDALKLVGREQQARIVLNGMVYTLRVTRQGKLILTK